MRGHDLSNRVGRLWKQIAGIVGGTDNSLVRIDGTDGSVQGSAVVVDDSGNITSFGGQIKFPATQNASADANTLDDYEEQSFTPVLNGTTDAGVGTYSVQQGRYTKIGNRYYFDITLVWSAHTGTGNMQIAGLPFTAAGDTPCNVYASNLTFPGQLVALAAGGGTTLTLGSMATGAATALIAMDTAATLVIAGMVRV